MTGKRGFTLLEVLIATVLMTVGVTALVWALNIWLVASPDIENTNLALNLAQAKMESLYDSYAAVADEAKAVISGFSAPVTTGTGYNTAFQRQVAVTVIDDHTKEVSVTVSWTVKGGEASVNLKTRMTSH